MFNPIMSLRPFISFYGSKWSKIKEYPNPRFNTIIEPFAGSASYATRYHYLNVILYDVDPAIAGIWDYLIRVKESEFRQLPVDFKNRNDLKINEEARNLIGFWLNPGSSTPKNQKSMWAQQRKGNVWNDILRDRIASQLKYIRHWRIYNKSYNTAPNDKATWFIDPPYSGEAGRRYIFNTIYYGELAKWCKERSGQVIVCENTDNNGWLPFKFLCNFNGTSKVSQEVIWTND